MPADCCRYSVIVFANETSLGGLSRSSISSESDFLKRLSRVKFFTSGMPLLKVSNETFSLNPKARANLRRVAIVQDE